MDEQDLDNPWHLLSPLHHSTIPSLLSFRSRSRSRLIAARQNLSPSVLSEASVVSLPFLDVLCESHGSIPIGIDASGRGGNLSLCGLVATFERSTGVELFPYKAKW